METLGLGPAREREDNFFQRMFWPSVRNQYDVDLIGRRGFWLALIIGVCSSLLLAFQRQPGAAVFTLAVFLLGAAGIRERSVPASIFIFTIYTTGIVLRWVSAVVLGVPGGNPLFSIVCVALLLSCVRATLLSRQFAEHGDAEYPAAADTGAMHTVVNRLPRMVWPRASVVFFVLATAYLLLTVAGSARMVALARVAKARSAESPRTYEVPLKVTPPANR